MNFAEAEQKYRELEEKLLGGELTEDEFFDQVAQLRVTDREGRYWMLSGRTGRWLLHDGQQWVFAEPFEDLDEYEAGGAEGAFPVAAAATTVVGPAPQPVATETVVMPAPKARRRPRPARWRITPRMLATGLAVLLVIACLIGGGVSAWVLVLRDLGEATPTPSGEPTAVGLVVTYTPRPVTPTYTPTPSSTPTRAPTATSTPLPTDTPPPTQTRPPASPTPVVPSPSVTSVASSTPASTSTPAPATVAVAPSPTQVTYTVRPGDTLSEIASRFDVSTSALAAANNITNPALIRVGQVLIIPSPAATTIASAGTPTPTWTPISLSTPRATTSATPSRTPTPTPTRTGPTSTPRPTNTPTRAPTATSPPRQLSGKIAFTVWNGPLAKYELYVSRIDGTGRNRIGQGFRQPQFRQDGNVLAVNGDGAANFEHLVQMNPSGGALAEVSNYTEDSFPTWSPDGAIVAYSSSSWGDGAVRLGVVHDMFGKQQDWIHIGTTEIRGEYPFWMADGRVVYHGCDFLGDHAACGLFWVGAGGGNYQRLTTESSDTAPAGAGTRVAFMSARDGNWEVYSVNMDGSGLKRLTNNGTNDGLPTWSPDGLSIAFVSDRSGAWAIWVMDANGGNQRKLFDLGGGYGSGNYDWTSERISWAP